MWAFFSRRLRMWLLLAGGVPAGQQVERIRVRPSGARAATLGPGLA